MSKELADRLENLAVHLKGTVYLHPEHVTALGEAIAALRSEPVVWIDGFPSKPWSNEWFIAETTYGDRVVLTALPEEYAYDFKTADDTYIKADKIKRWMQFPDSEYLAPSLESRTDRAEPVAGQLSAAHIRAIRKQWDGDMYPCNAEFYALCDMALRSLTARDEWKEAVIDELVVSETLTKEHETNPRKAIADVIHWNIQVALDPAVSSDAQKLVNEGIEAAAKILHEPWASAVRELKGTKP